MNVGTVISGKYQIQKEIKRGGFGIIYQGLNINFDKQVAIKAIEPSLLNEAKFIDMFQQEALDIARLNHPNIIQVYDIKREENGQIFIIMEYIDGCDLLSLLKTCSQKEKPLPHYLTAHIISEICNGLDYAHNRRNPETNEPLNLVHKDISPVNIMLTKSGEVKIIDFGMANFLQNKQNNSKHVQIQGNVRYMAPEQIRTPDKMDCRADIFATGVILFEILTGERLIKSNSKQEIIETLLIGNYDLSRLESEKIPNKLRQITVKTLQPDPNNRYNNATQMYRDLMHFLIMTAPAANYVNDLANFITHIDPVHVTEPNGTIVENASNNGISDEINAETQINTESVIDIPDATAINTESEIETSEFEVSENKEKNANLNIFNEASVDSIQTQKSENARAAGNEFDINENINETTFKQQEASPKFYSFVEESEENNQKTIIDVVRLSARTHKKAITISLLTLIISFLGFTAVDTFANLTPMGTGIYDFLFPPAIKVFSVPSGANVYLDDKLLDKTTPISLDEIKPGVHKLMLTLPQYESIVKSINVLRKGELMLSGEAKRHASQPYILNFKTQLDIVSKPAGAKIIIDGVKLNQQTPATIFWDVSEQPTYIDLEIDGLPKLTGLSINTVSGQDIVQDKRIWKINKPIEGKSHYLLEGVFHKNITIQSRPKLADIYFDGSEKPVGVTGLNGNMLLTIGTHNFTLKKDGYASSTFDVDVNENIQGIIHRDLERSIRIFSKDALSGVDSDLGANLVYLSLNGSAKKFNNTKTPAVVNVLPYTYKAKLSKPGFHDVEIEIKPDDYSVVAKMQPLYYQIIVEAIDAITSSPVNTAKISYLQEYDTNSEQILGLTDISGTVQGKLMPGTYEVTVEKEGYQKQKKSIRLNADSMNRLTFRLTSF